jgi:hypothetical protein
VHRPRQGTPSSGVGRSDDLGSSKPSASTNPSALSATCSTPRSTKSKYQLTIAKLPLAKDGGGPFACRHGFVPPVRVLSRLFRCLFLQNLQAAFAAGQLGFFGDLAHLADPAAFAERLDQLRQTEWVVYAKPPFGGPEQVLAHIGRYTHRVATANSLLISLADDVMEASVTGQGAAPGRRGGADRRPQAGPWLRPIDRATRQERCDRCGDDRLIRRDIQQGTEPAYDAVHEELQALVKAGLGLIDFRMRSESQSEHAAPVLVQKAHTRVLKSLASEICQA